MKCDACRKAEPSMYLMAERNYRPFEWIDSAVNICESCYRSVCAFRWTPMVLVYGQEIVTLDLDKNFRKIPGGAPR